MKTSKVTLASLSLFWWSNIIGLAFGEPVRLDLKSGDLDDLRQKYTTFIRELRSRIPTSGISHDIPVLLDSNSDLQPNQRYLFLEIAVSNGNAALILDVTDLNLVAFNIKDVFYYFEDGREEEIKYVAGGKRKKGIGSRNYRTLEHRATRNRADLLIGVDVLRESIQLLIKQVHDVRLRSLALLSIIQMISEVARYYQIEREVKIKNTDPNHRHRPSSEMLDLENKWRELSSGIQSSSDLGFLPEERPLVIREDDPIVPNSPVRRRYLIRVNEYVQSAVAFLFFDGNHNRTWQSRSVSHYLVNDIQHSRAKDPEPVSIMGFNNLCADVYGGFRNNGNNIIMMPCKDAGNENQMWTFKADGTIRWKNKCLTAYGFAPGDYIMIFHCEMANQNAKQWKLSSAGDIINPFSGLLLTSKLGVEGSYLTVENPENVLGQGWRVYRGSFSHNTTHTPVTSIVTYGNLCLQFDDNQLKTDECAYYKRKQLWSFFADGSIRPYEKQDNCVSLNPEYAVVTVEPCKPYQSGQRFHYNKNGEITESPDRIVGVIAQENHWFFQIIR